jgi:putative ATPase
MKQLEYGKGYQYSHDEPEAIAAMDCLPPSLQGRQYYSPKQRGFEKEIARRLERWEEIKQQRRTAGAANRTDSPTRDDSAE